MPGNYLLTGLAFGFPDLAAPDIVGNLPAPTNIGSVTFSAGPISGEKRATFSGANRLTIAAPHAALQGYGARSWAEKLGINVALGTAVGVPMMLGLGGDGTGIDGFALELTADGYAVAQMALSDGSYAVARSAAVVCDATDHDILIRWIARTKTLSLFVDAAAPVATVAELLGGPADASNALWLGSSGVLDDGIIGSIYSPAAWLGVELTDAQVAIVQGRLPMASYDAAASGAMAGIASGVGDATGALTGTPGLMAGFAAGVGDATGALVSLPGIPFGLVPTALSQYAVHLGWQEDGGLQTGFEIWRKVGAGSYALLATVGDVREYVDGGLTADTLYTYKLRAIGAAGDSDFGIEQSVTTLTAIITANVAILRTGGGSGGRHITATGGGRGN